MLLWQALVLSNTENLCLVDGEDFEELNKVKWHFKQVNEYIGYVARCKRIGSQVITIYIHRVITNCPKGLLPHHINGCPFDNRKQNLEILSSEENVRQQNKYYRNDRKTQNQEFSPPQILGD